MTTQQPEALDLANWLDAVGNGGMSSTAAAVELRRQHTRIAEQPAGAQQPGAAYAALHYKQALGSTNCMQCCVSYMMGLPLENVPDFATDGGWERFSDFAETQGYVAVMLPGNREYEADYLASGTTARGTSHMVVMNDGKLVHDPHPSNAGLVDVQCVWLLAKRASPTQGQQDEHTAFEASAKTYTSNVSFERDASDYVDMTASLLWHGWKLRASHWQAPAQAAPAAVEGCTRSHPHENMDSACRAKAAIAEMQNMAARGAEATAHDLDRFVAMLAAAPAARPSPTPQADSQPAQVEVADAVADSQYLAGVSAGWNAANADNPNEALRKLHESRAGYLKPLSAARAPADSVLEDAERWKMAVLVGSEVMLHPEKRTHPAAVKAYMDAVHSGLDLTGAIDAASKQGGKP